MMEDEDESQKQAENPALITQAGLNHEKYQTSMYPFFKKLLL